MASKDQELILSKLEERGKLDSYEFSREFDRDHQAIVGAIKSLQSVGNVSFTSVGGLYLEILHPCSVRARAREASGLRDARRCPAQVISTEQRQFESWVLTAEGAEVSEQGSHEARIFAVVDPESGTLQMELMVR